MQIKKVSGVILAVALSGCGIFGPSYTKPDVGAPAAWNSKDSIANLGDGKHVIDLPDLAWWKKFNDPKLNELMVEAMKNNNQIQMAIGNIIQAQGLLQQIEMMWVPTVNVVPGYGQNGWYGGTNANSGSTGGGASTGTTGSTLGTNGYSVGVVPNYSLNILQQIRQQQAASASLRAAKSTHDAMRLTIISQVVAGYFTLLEQNYALQLQQQLVKDAGERDELARGQYKNGYISLLDLQNYEQVYEQAKVQVPIIEANIVASQNALQVLVNKNPGVVPTGLDFTKIAMDGIVPGNVPSTVLRQRPDVVAAEEQLIAANANIGVATANFFPTISLTGGVGTASSQLAGLFSSYNDYWSAAVNAVMPVLNLSYFGSIRQAKGAYYTAYYNYIFTVRGAFAQVDNALATHQKSTDSYKEQLQVYNSTVLANQLGDERFKQGLDSLVTSLNYKITMDNSAITLATSKLNQVQSIVNLYQAMAGGYNVDNTDKPKKFGDGHDAD